MQCHSQTIVYRVDFKIMTRRTSGDETWNRLLLWTKGSKASERLSGHILAAEGFQSIDPSHPLGGPDGLKDFVMRKNNLTWIGASYFPRGQQDFKDTIGKFTKDLQGVKKNKVRGLAFITNQEMTLDQRNTLKRIGKPVTVEIFHLERVSSILDRAENYGVRLEYLDIELSKEEQLAVFSTSSNRIALLTSKLETMLQSYENFTKATQRKRSKPYIKRSRRAVEEALDEFFDRVWYDRHQLLKNSIAKRKEKVDPAIWNAAQKAAHNIENKFGRKNLGPYSDFDWGMVNGKLSAIRWILGDDWDFLDT